MIQILLFLLKFIGIALLALLGIILFLLVVVLFVPICYKARVIHNPEKTCVRASVHWMFPAVWVTLQYLKEFSYKVRVFGYAILDSTKPQKEKKTKPVTQKKPESTVEKKPASVAPEQSVPVEPEKPAEPKSAEPEKPAEPKSAEPENPVEVEITSGEPVKEEPKKEEPKPQKKAKKEKKSIGDLIEKIKHLLRQKDEVLRILDKPESKQAISYAWNKLKHLLKHILPRRIKGYVAYGSSDPATTGKVLGVISMIYAKTGMLAEIKPNFEEEQLECDLEIRGRIQVFTLLLIAAKVFFNKELRGLIKDFKNIKNIA